MASSAMAVARHILGSLGPMNSIKLQKLVYYSQAYNLAWRGEALFPERIEAWPHGPVVPALYEQHAGQVMVYPGDIAVGESDVLSEDDKAVVNSVVAAFGRLSGWDLRERTHREAPWVTHFTRSGPWQTIPLEDMRLFYSRNVRD